MERNAWYWVEVTYLMGPFRQNKYKNPRNKTDIIFVPPTQFQPIHSSLSGLTDVILVYNRSAAKGLKEEKDPPPFNSKDAKEGGIYKWLEQNEYNHPKAGNKATKKDGQIIFNKLNISAIHRSKIPKKPSFSEEGTSLAEFLFGMHENLYEEDGTPSRNRTQFIEQRKDFDRKTMEHYFDIQWRKK